MSLGSFNAGASSFSYAEVGGGGGWKVQKVSTP